jgi:hypothetical protein
MIHKPTTYTNKYKIKQNTTLFIYNVVVDAMGRVVTQGREETSTAGLRRVELMSPHWSAGTYSVRLRWQGTESTDARTLRLVKLHR